MKNCEIKSAILQQADTRVSFANLPEGARFRFPICLGHLLIHRGVYFKAGAGWYGLKPGDRLFPWLDESPYVEAL